MNILAIDPGTVESAFVVWDGTIIRDLGKIENDKLLEILDNANRKSISLVIEQIKSYGMAIGQTTIDTIFWSGRFYQAWSGDAYLLPRIEVKKHICNNGAAKDGNIIQALVDRFAYGEKNKGKGTKKQPGFFYGFKSDIWQAFALAVTFIDKQGL